MRLSSLTKIQYLMFRCIFPEFLVLCSFYFCVRVLSRVRLFASPWPVAHQAPLSMGFCRQEYWSGLPCPPPGHLLTQGWNPRLLHCRWILHCWAMGSPSVSSTKWTLRPHILTPGPHADFPDCLKKCIIGFFESGSSLGPQFTFVCCVSDTLLILGGTILSFLSPLSLKAVCWKVICLMEHTMLWILPTIFSW